MNKRLLIVGNPDPVHIGKHLLDAAKALSIPTALIDTRQSFSSSRLLNRVFWHLLDHRPPRQIPFNRQVVSEAGNFRPTHVLTTGLTPLTARTVQHLVSTGVRCLNYSTDDPWNSVHHCGWHQRALSQFSAVFTPRSANRSDFLKAGCKNVGILPFGYSPSSHFIADQSPEADTGTSGSGEVLFAGGADKDRLEYVQALIGAGIKPILYGNSWQRHTWARPFHHGFLSLEQQRHLISRIPLCLVLVRRANRDGHSMRTFEIPAMGGCLVTERTDDHQTLFGKNGDSTRYFDTPAELVSVCRQMMASPKERMRMAQRSHELVIHGGNSYHDRLTTMLSESSQIRPTGQPS